MRYLAIVFALALMLIPMRVSAQSMDQAQAQLSGILREIEVNLVEKEAIEMNFKVWQANEDALKPRLDDLNRRIEEENAYCQGTYEQAEYERRKAHCDGVSSQLDTLKAQLAPEIEHSETELLKLQQRETERAKAMDAINPRLTAALGQLTFACATMSAEEFAASCHLPPAAGPRSAEMVAQLNAAMAGKVK